MVIMYGRKLSAKDGIEALRLTALPEIIFFYSEFGNSGQSGLLTRYFYRLFDCFRINCVGFDEFECPREGIS